MRPLIATVAAGALCAPAFAQSLRLVASASGADIDVPASGATTTVAFSGVAEPVEGFGVTALFTAPIADQSDGLYPWSVDFEVVAFAPGGASAVSPSPWFGDRSFADFPVADAFGGLGGVDGAGVWTLQLDSGVVPPYVAGLRGVTYHLLADAPSVEHEYADTTAQGNSWSRPFFIAGVSGLGPVDYHALRFRVSEAGLYGFVSVRDDADDHWSCLYIDEFDDTAPLANLQDYGLGNGLSPFGTERGTSAFDQLLFADRAYIWVTSQWDSISPNAEFVNTITGPGDVIVVGAGCNAADLAEPLGSLDFSDVVAFLTAFGDSEPGADLAEPFGQWDFSDVVAFLGAFGAGCR